MKSPNVNNADNEFALIERYFSSHSNKRKDVSLGIGDDCALLQVPPDQELAVTIDTLVEGVHFYPNASPTELGYKALAVSLSDLAAMAAEPAWATLALTLPAVNHDWLTAFSESFFALLNQHKMSLVGGNMSRGPLSITVQAHGFVPRGQALQRNVAKPGDLIYVTGNLGGAALALAAKQVYCSEIHSEEAISLRGIAHAAIDISDGLAADLNHILEMSQVGASVRIQDLPIEPKLLQQYGLEKALQIIMDCGDDYELCFTVPKERQEQLSRVAASWNCAYTCIGVIEGELGLRWVKPDGGLLELRDKGYEHFRS